MCVCFGVREVVLFCLFWGAYFCEVGLGGDSLIYTVITIVPLLKFVTATENSEKKIVR